MNDRSNLQPLSDTELTEQAGTALPDKEVVSILDLNADLDLGLAVAAPIDLAVAANANVAAPIDAAVGANILSDGSTSTSLADQGVLLNQGITGDAHAVSDQDSVIDHTADPTGTTAPADAPAPAPADTTAPTDAPTPAPTDAPTPAPTDAPADTTVPTNAPADTTVPTNAPVDTTVPTDAPAPSGDATTGAVTGAVDGATGAVGDTTGAVGGVTDAVGGTTGAVDGATGAVDGATGAVGGVTGAVDGATGGLSAGDLSSLDGSLLNVNVDLAADAEVTAPINGAVAANANVAAPIDAAVSANIGSVDSDAVAVAQQTAIINQTIDGDVSADAGQNSTVSNP